MKSACPATFYRWYEQYQRDGIEGLQDQSSQPRQFWNRIPEPVRDRVVQIVLEYPERSPRELSWHITDTEGYEQMSFDMFGLDLHCYLSAEQIAPQFA